MKFTLHQLQQFIADDGNSVTSGKSRHEILKRFNTDEYKLNRMICQMRADGAYVLTIYDGEDYRFIGSLAKGYQYKERKPCRALVLDVLRNSPGDTWQSSELVDMLDIDRVTISNALRFLMGKHPQIKRRELPCAGKVMFEWWWQE